MTLDHYQPPTNDLVLAPQDVAIRRLGEWAQSAEAAHHIATELVKTSFVPDGFRGKPGEATAAILAGLEVGLQPMAALRSFDVIQGQAAPRAITLRAIVQSNGHDIELVESTATRCKMRGRRRGAGAWTDVIWTLDRAKSLGVTGKNNWKTQPQAMLVARATSELARLIAADAILGIAYSAEEIADGAGAGFEVPVVVTAEQTAAEPATGKRMSRKKADTAPTDDPPIEDAEVVEPAHDDSFDKPTDAQTKKAMASFGDQGFGDKEQRDDRLAITATFVGHPVGSWSELTRSEASIVIDALASWQAGDITLIATDDGGWAIQSANDNLYNEDDPL